VAVGLSARAAAGHVQRDLPEFLARDDLSDESKKAILHDNPINFYRLTI
jgi:hypothetical protein